jgi:N-acetylglucosamine-6-phosphate deacetylase
MTGAHGRSTHVERFTVRGNLALGDRLRPGAVIVEAGRIAEVTRQQDDWALPAPILDSPIVAPGYVDLQVNGGFGIEAGSDPIALQALAEKLPSTGVTAWLPTVITSPAAFYREVLSSFPAAADSVAGARILGLHLEGPFLSPARKGAHRAEWMDAADDALFAELIASDALRLMTVAPERPGALDRIRRLSERDVVVSLGHTNATVAEYTAGIDAGATMATHLFNAMSPFGHREPGAIGAILTDDRVTAGLIADGVHSHPAALHLAFQAKGPDKIALVTDMMAAAGMPPGTYPLGDQLVTTDGVSARLADGTLAGATLRMDAAVRNMAAWTGASIADAIRMATETPATILGRPDLGRLAAGNPADLTLLDDDLAVVATLIAGRKVYER